jgi:DNA-binding XRE family transcriptional regulator
MMINVKKELKSQERSLAWLSRQLGVSETCIYKWSTGRTIPSRANRIAIASVLNMPYEELFKE